MPLERSSGSVPPLARRRFLHAIALAGLGRLVSPLSGQDEAEFLIGPRLRKMAEGAPLALQFSGGSAVECGKWQKAFKTQLEILLGPHQPPREWTSVIERTVELADHVREERILTAPGLNPLPLHLLRPTRKPDESAAKFAGIVAVHGHGMDNDSIAGRDDTAELKSTIAKFRCDYASRGKSLRVMS